MGYLGIDFHKCKSIAIFKKKINALIRPSGKPTYGIHHPNGLKFIVQIRVVRCDVIKENIILMIHLLTSNGRNA